MSVTGFVLYNSQPVPNASVKLLLPDGSTQTTTSAADGAYAFTLMSAGTYTISAETAFPNITTPAAIQIFYDGVNAIAAGADLTYTATTEQRTTQANWLLKALPALASLFCLNNASDEILCMIDDAMSRCGFDIEQVNAFATDDLRKWQLVLKLQAWDWIRGNVSMWHNWSADGGSFSRGQVFAHAEKMYERLENDAYREGLCGYQLPGIAYDAENCFGCGGANIYGSRGGAVFYG